MNVQTIRRTKMKNKLSFYLVLVVCTVMLLSATLLVDGKRFSYQNVIFPDNWYEVTAPLEDFSRG